jgi:V8-like Glu-specific endopeptidase
MSSPLVGGSLLCPTGFAVGLFWSLPSGYAMMSRAKEKPQSSFSFGEDLLSGGQVTYTDTTTNEVPRYSVDKYPYNDVALLEFTRTHQSTFGISSGVVIGPHTILTASHSMFPGGKTADDWDIFMRYSAGNFPNPGSSKALSGRSEIHYFNVGRDGTMTRHESESDYAIIDTKHKFTSWFGVQSEYSGGKVHMTGYPGYLGGRQQDVHGTVDRNSTYDVLDYETFNAHPGNSGGPIWVDKKPGPGVEPYVVGIVSTTDWATLISTEVFRQIRKWVHGDGYGFGRQAGDGDVSPRLGDADSFDLRHDRQETHDRHHVPDLELPLAVPDAADMHFAM